MKTSETKTYTSYDQFDTCLLKNQIIKTLESRDASLETAKFFTKQGEELADIKSFLADCISQAHAIIQFTPSLDSILYTEGGYFEADVIQWGSEFGIELHTCFDDTKR